MRTKPNRCRLDFGQLGHYDGNRAHKGVTKMHTGRAHRRATVKCVTVFLLIGVFLAAGAAIGLSDGRLRSVSAGERYINYLSVLNYSLLSSVIDDLIGSEVAEAREEFIKDPRARLDEEGLDLPEESFRITAVNPLLGVDAGVYGVSEQRDPELKAAHQGLAVVYENVAVALQVVLPDPEEVPAIDMFFTTMFFIGDDILDALVRAMQTLNKAKRGGEERTAFLDNPRAYFWEDEMIQLSKDELKVWSFDLEEARDFQERMSSPDTNWHLLYADEEQVGAEFLHEAIVLFDEDLCLLVQQAF